MPPKITQLYPQLELFSEGEPPRHTLFVMGRLLGTPDQLLLIDPPADVADRFSLAENTAVLFTGIDAPDLGLPQLQTMAGGAAHISIGQHLLDIYSHPTGNVIYLPALKILCGGRFGSDLLLPTLATGSDGSDELEILRRLAQLAKARPLQLYIPQTGSLTSDPIQVMTRLANDVGYLHGLRRVLPAAIRRGDDLIKVQQIASTLIPENRRSPICQQIHQKNVETLFRLIQNDGLEG
jgi:hypothetical protein